MTGEMTGEKTGVLNNVMGKKNSGRKMTGAIEGATI